MKRVLFLDHASALGGAEHSLLLILKHLHERHWEVHLACIPGQLTERAKELDISVHPTSFPRLRRSPHFFLDWFNGANTIAELARKISAKALYANTIRAAMYGVFAAKLARLPFIWHMRDFWLSESRPSLVGLDRMGKRLLIGGAIRVLTNSNAVATHLPASPKISVVHNSIEIERYDPALDGRLFRAQYGILEEVPVVGMVGRLRPWKGQKRFLLAMARIAKELPKARFLIVGGEIFGVRDDYEQELYSMTASLGLEGHAIFTGQLNDVRPALAAMDVFVHPGDPEPFGLVNIEAMAMCKPIAAFAHGALPEIIVRDETGLLVHPRDEAALADAVLALLRDPSRRKIMGLAGRRRVEEYFTVQQTVAGVEKCLNEVL